MVEGVDWKVKAVGGFHRRFDFVLQLWSLGRFNGYLDL